MTSKARKSQLPEAAEPLQLSRCSAHWMALVRLLFSTKMMLSSSVHYRLQRRSKAVPECVVNVYDIDDTAKMTEEIQSSDIFANATIVGMKPLDDQSVVKDLSAFRPGLVVADAVYNPQETKLLREAKEAGCTCVGGKGMLLWQGVAAFKLYTGQDMPVDDVKKLFFS